MMTNGDNRKGLIIVTGGTRGIGAAITVSAARVGHPVLINFAVDASAAEPSCRRSGRRAAMSIVCRPISPMSKAC